MPVVGAAPALADGTASVEPAGEAETATTAKLEALAPWAQGMAGREVEKLPQKRTLDALSRVDTKGVAGRMHEALPPEVRREPSWSPQKPSREDVLSTWEGPGPWDRGGRPPWEHIIESKWPVEAMDIARGIDAHIKRDLSHQN